MTREGYNKHKELIEAFGNGAEIQYYGGEPKRWIDIENPTWTLETKYRIKYTKLELEDCHFNEIEYKVDKIGKVVEVRVDRLKININRTKSTLFKDKEIAETYAVLPKLIRLRDEYNEGWKPDWNNKDIKYTIEKFKTDLIASTTYNSTRLISFKSEETRDRFFEDHKDLLEIAKPLL